MRADPARDRLREAVAAALDKKAEGIEVLDLRGLSGITDYFIICHGASARQVQAIVDEIDRRLRAARVHPGHIEGAHEAGWVLMDYLDFVVHVFNRDRRSFYALEKLWADAPRVDLAAAPRRSLARRKAPRA
jgi:ribosome-associated protein